MSPAENEKYDKIMSSKEKSEILRELEQEDQEDDHLEELLQGKTEKEILEQIDGEEITMFSFPLEYEEIIKKFISNHAYYILFF